MPNNNLGEALPLRALGLSEESRGVVDCDIDSLEGIDAERRITMARLSEAYGETLNEPEELIDNELVLEMAADSMDRAAPEVLNFGLYIPPQDKRYRTANNLITVSNESTSFIAPGVMDRYTGVVFPGNQFTTIARNALDLVRHTKAKSQAKNADNPNREEVFRKMNTSAGMVLDRYHQELYKIDDTLVSERNFLAKMYKESGSTWIAHYKAKNLDKHRKKTDEIIHEAAEVASLNLNISNFTVNALHATIVRNLYRRGSKRELIEQRQRYIEWAGRYANARRGKVAQSRDACERQLMHYAKFIEAKQQ